MGSQARVQHGGIVLREAEGFLAIVAAFVAHGLSRERNTVIGMANCCDRRILCVVDPIRRPSHSRFRPACRGAAARSRPRYIRTTDTQLTRLMMEAQPPTAVNQAITSCRDYYADVA